ncbi:MAG: hypothetical protein JO257_08755 [Deltaproteobacteria bacterium]|nr:hypothetical protein [Deltaproteobacteria bacterium]
MALHLAPLAGLLHRVGVDELELLALLDPLHLFDGHRALDHLDLLLRQPGLDDPRVQRTIVDVGEPQVVVLFRDCIDEVAVAGPVDQLGHRTPDAARVAEHAQRMSGRILWELPGFRVVVQPREHLRATGREVRSRGRGGPRCRVTRREKDAEENDVLHRFHDGATSPPST